MSISYTYIEALSKGFPSVQFSATSDLYEDITHIAGPTMPTQVELDQWIADDIKIDLWDAIKAERDRRKNDGGYKVGANWYHSDTSSRIQQIGLVMMGAGIPANMYWKTMAGGFVLMTPTLALQIFQTAAASDMAIFTVAEQKKATMIASATPASYDYLSGWPLIYGE
jgi:hypothetical protein